MLKAKQIGTRENANLEVAKSDLVKEPLVRLNVNLPQGQYRALRKKALENDVSVTALVGRWVRAYVGDE